MRRADQRSVTAQLSLFDAAADSEPYVYVVCVDGYRWSVRKSTNGEELFSRDERGSARQEAEARGYILKQN